MGGAPLLQLASMKVNTIRAALLVLILTCLYGNTQSVTIQTCIEYSASPVIEYLTVYQVSYYSCGWGGFGVCSKQSSYKTQYTVYVAVKECCKGYGGANCTAYCSFECKYNSLCSQPEKCTCIDGWEGSNCLIDVNECDTNIDECEFSDTCQNTEGSYNCSCVDVDQVLAKDGRRCLEAVPNLVLKPGKRTVKFELTIPDSFHDDGVFDGFDAGCTAVPPSTVTHHKNQVFYGNATTIDLTDLLPYTSYNCCVQPRWLFNGHGPVKCDETVTLQDAPDDAPSNVTIETVSERSALIKWSPPTVLNGILNQYNIYLNYTNSTPLHLISIPSSNIFFLHEYLEPYQTVGVAISAVTVGGESPRSAYRYTTTHQDEPGAVDDLSVDILAPYAVNITWYPPQALNGIILQYYMNVTKETPNDLKALFYYDELEPDEEFYIVLNNLDPPIIVKEGSGYMRLDPYVPYTVTVAAATIIGHGEVFPVTFFTAQNTPLVTPTILSVQLSTPLVAVVRWEALKFWQLRGFLSQYQVTVLESNDRYCNNTTNDRKISTKLATASFSVNPFKKYCVAVLAASSVGLGEASEHWYLQDQMSSPFEVHLIGVGDCELWVHDNTEGKLNATLETLAGAISTRCGCDVRVSYFNNARLVCTNVDMNRVVIQAKVIGIPEADSNTFVEYLHHWVTSESTTVIVQGTRLTPDPSCPTDIDSAQLESTSERPANVDCITVTEPTEPYIGSSQALNTERIISVVLGIAIGLCILVIVGLLAFICYTHIKHSRAPTRLKYSKPHPSTGKHTATSGNIGEDDCEMLIVQEPQDDDDGGSIGFKVDQQPNTTTGPVDSADDSDSSTISDLAGEMDLMKDENPILNETTEKDQPLQLGKSWSNSDTGGIFNTIAMLDDDAEDDPEVLY